jgi:diadenosine tetraphosphatase ApaH/serine/threonine PP2A family protein phosphatase
MPRVFAIGDIHGCVDELNTLLTQLAPKPDDTLVFLGDYIDRGPTPKGVVDRLLRLRESTGCVFLKGNHEDMFLDFMGLGGRYGEAFLYNGGGATLRSYGCHGCEGAEVAEHLPAAHREFYLQLQPYHRDGDFLFVHAGVRPGLRLEQQSAEDLMWIREEFTAQPHDLGCTVLFGHTPFREVLVDLPYKIGLDTGVVYRNKLSCFETVARTLHQVGRGDQQVKTTSLAHRFA